MAQNPTINPTPAILPPLADGDVLQAPSGAWLVVGDTPGQQSRQRVLLTAAYTDPVINVDDAALAKIPEVGGVRTAQNLTAEKALAQIAVLTGAPWPKPHNCSAESQKYAEDYSKVRDALNAKYEQLVKMLAATDASAQTALTKSFLAAKAEADKAVMGGLAAAAAVASVVPVVGPVISALLNIISAASGGVAVGPMPQVTKVRDKFEWESYRGFSPGLFYAERPIGEYDTWDGVETALAQRRLQFVSRVDFVLDTLSRALRVDFFCIFPAWWERSNIDSRQLRQARALAQRWGADKAFMSKAQLDYGQKPRYLIELLPNPDSEEIKALLSGNASKLQSDAVIRAMQEAEAKKRQERPEAQPSKG